MSDPQDSREADDVESPVPPRRSTRQRVLIAVGTIATIAALGAVLVVGYTYWRLDQIPRYGVETSEVVDDEPVNYLVVGSDSRENIDEDDPDAEGFLDGETFGEAQRADVIILIRVHPEGDRIEVLSIPRDLWIPISPSGETGRINSAYGGEAGAQQLIDTIEGSLDVPIHHYVEVDFRGFQAVVDEVGGVPMYFDTAYRDRNSGLAIPDAGCYVLDGQQALAFVRARHLEYVNENGVWDSDPTGDLGRISRQQIFIRNALSQARDQAQITNPVEYNALIDVAVEHVRISEGVDIGRLAATGQRFAEFEGDTIETFSLPVEEYTTGGGAQVVRLDQAAAQPVLNVFRGLPPDAIDPAMIELQVLNGSGIRGQAGLASEAFAAVGFRTVEPADVPGTSSDPLEQTEVHFAPGDEALASLVERHLTAGGVLVVDDALESGHVVVETGSDFTTVEEEARPADDAAPTTAAATTDDSAADESEADDGAAEDDATSESPSTTATTVIGVTPGEIPEGESCE